MILKIYLDKALKGLFFCYKLINESFDVKIIVESLIIKNRH